MCFGSGNTPQSPIVTQAPAAGIPSAMKKSTIVDEKTAKKKKKLKDLEIPEVEDLRSAPTRPEGV